MIKLNDVVVTPTIFPDKTSQVWKIDKSILKDNTNSITWEFVNEQSLSEIRDILSKS